MRSRNNTVGSGTRLTRYSGQDLELIKRLAILLLIAVFFITLTAEIAEAGAMDSVRNAWGSMRGFVFSGAFWINAALLFCGLFVLQIIFLSKMMGSDSAQKTVLYVAIAIIAVIIATKLVGTNGQPQYLWENEQFRSATQFLIGPSAENQMRSCAGPTHSFWRSLLGVEPNPPCCGSGAYAIQIPNRQAPSCKQAILRTNENGSGIPALIISFILFYLLFNAYSSNLGFDKTGKWFPIGLSLVLAALITNERITKSNIIMIGGWIAVIILGSKLAKSMSGDKDPKGSKKGFGFGLAFAFVQLIAGALGTSLLGGTVTAGQIGTGFIVKNLMIGIAVGFIYSALVGGGIFGRIMENVNKKKEDEIKQLIEEGSYVKPFARALPGIGRLPWFKPKKETAESTKEDDRIIDLMNKVWEKAEEAHARKDHARRVMYEEEFMRLREELHRIRNKATASANIESVGNPGANSTGSGTGAEAGSEGAANSDDTPSHPTGPPRMPPLR